MSMVNGKRPELSPRMLVRPPLPTSKGMTKSERRERKRRARTVRMAQYVQFHILAFGLAADIDMSKSARDRFAHDEAMARKYTTTGTTA